MSGSFRRCRFAWLLICLCFAGLVAASPYTVLGSVLEQADLPAHGWSVCWVGGEETVPGQPDPRQVFELCHADGWQLRAYCLQPGMPAPQVGTMCSQEGGVFWCGDAIQQLQFYAVLQTPAATLTPTQTATATATSTSTATPPNTATLTPTLTITTTLTETPVLETLTLTPEYQQITVEVSETATTQAWSTTVVRPRAGGPGNAGLVYGLLGGAGCFLAVIGWRLRRRPKKTGK